MRDHFQGVRQSGAGRIPDIIIMKFSCLVDQEETVPVRCDQDVRHLYRHRPQVVLRGLNHCFSGDEGSPGGEQGQKQTLVLGHRGQGRASGSLLHGQKVEGVSSLVHDHGLYAKGVVQSGQDGPDIIRPIQNKVVAHEHGRAVGQTQGHEVESRLAMGVRSNVYAVRQRHESNFAGIARGKIKKSHFSCAVVAHAHFLVAVHGQQQGLLVRVPGDDVPGLCIDLGW